MKIHSSEVDLTLAGIERDNNTINDKGDDRTCEDDVAISEAVAEIEKELGPRQNDLLNNAVTFAIVAGIVAFLIHFSGGFQFMK
mmetsp:Transcript_13599/g.20397  ORF Transcript_13599/g.20397 Transcript_13599/m.20397 type:complete len:84 (+) Transcript_13599:68-319(+)|eukprot:CAMPEP_0185024206 /NCGR_PEP_ID=MMETSP1103-20130426/7189_1 /TAXON_ID=36769 /ORGANISM="Paraphysomonas bandaiensis, Strain Caron Lab Isolate" /LENGTH=83 /DNA_ID=CAMNT_0027557117 /DNA_START=68 /DNA_END=319 /DNA_ORIENTATION=-